jgi:uncharacterized protein (TIGR04255 family)
MNPPIIEALCEFQFIPSQQWDMTIPGLLYDRVHEQFPVRQQQMSLGIGFQSKEDGLRQKVETAPRMQFYRSDKSALVQVGPDLLTVNHLKPYPSWEVFKPIIFDNFEKHRDIAKPKGFKSIALRYINKINFDERLIELGDYFNYYPLIPKDLPQTHGAFSTHIEIPYESERDRLLLVFATVAPEKPDSISLLLDINYAMVIPERITLDLASEWVEMAHTRIEIAFEACITERCRCLFAEVK